MVYLDREGLKAGHGERTFVWLLLFSLHTNPFSESVALCGKYKILGQWINNRSYSKTVGNFGKQGQHTVSSVTRMLFWWFGVSPVGWVRSPWDGAVTASGQPAFAGALFLGAAFCLFTFFFFWLIKTLTKHLVNLQAFWITDSKQLAAVFSKVCCLSIFYFNYQSIPNSTLNWFLYWFSFPKSLHFCGMVLLYCHSPKVSNSQLDKQFYFKGWI